MAIYIKADAAGCPTCDSCAADVPCPKPTITSDLAPAAVTRFTSFSYTITASGSPTSFDAASLPSGLSINTTTGEISGTLPDCDTYNISISAINACGTDTETLVLEVTGPSPAITSAATAVAFTGVPFSYFITATNTPTLFGAVGTPPGLSLDTATGEISGTPTDEINYNVNLSASNACGTGTMDLAIVIAGEPVLRCDSIEATHSKFGFGENAGYESTPPKIYLRLTASGTSTQNQWTGPDCTTTPLPDNVNAFSGYQEYDEDAALIADGIAVNGTVIPGAGNLPVPCGTLECIPVDTATTRTYTGDGICYNGYPAFKYTGTVVGTFSDEFTTTELIAKAVSNLPSYPGTWDGDCSAYRDLDADELAYTLRRFKYKFELPDLTGFTTYRIDWMEGSTARYYTWNGTDTETGVYTVAEPGTNGFIYITAVEASGT